MKLFLDKSTTRKFSTLLSTIPKEVKRISAAVAFSTDDTLLKHCEKRNVALEWWGRFDADGATRFSLIKRAIESPHVRFYPFGEFFHPKVIWFHDYGIYIGSHNMTYNARLYNVEAGVFLAEGEIDADTHEKIIDYFEYLRANSIPATEEDLKRIEKFLEAGEMEREQMTEYRHRQDDLFREQFSHLFSLRAGATEFENLAGDGAAKRKQSFLKEWRETQKYLTIVKQRIVESCEQPSWVSPDAHPTIITDQLLHAYYYGYVKKEHGERKSIEAVHQEYRRSRGDQMGAVQRAISWWEHLEMAPNHEDLHINEWGPTVIRILSHLKDRDLSEAELREVFLRNHAVRNHARQIRNDVFSLSADFNTDEDERVAIYTKWLYPQKSREGLTLTEVLRYLLFNDDISVEDRVHDVVFNRRYRLDHFGKSIVGEIIGWGRPDATHLRNNRVNKALRCLGFDVRLFSE